MEFNLQDVDGVLYPHFIDVKVLRDLMADNVLLEDDAVILTHPKCGTTLTQQIVHLLRHDGNQPDSTMMEGCPWIESVVSDGKLPLADLKKDGRSPMIFKSHASPHLFPGDWRVPRIIIVTRNPKDTMVSLFHHMRNKKAFTFDGEWDEFFKMVMEKKVESSDFFDWHLGWFERFLQDDQRMIWMHYEDMIENLEDAVRTIANFLDISVSDEVIKSVAEQSTLDSMKTNPKANCEWISGKQGSHAKHLRKGGKGGWGDVFSEEQDKLYTEYMNSKLDEGERTMGERMQFHF
eukprot:m.24611 g.24611  ORF g.24611 m.24611 type:complete len:291 (-) comp5676_c0_seq1:969-1841(-)